jgi:hypothetical protein
MTRQITQQILAARAEIVASPAQRACDDHSFEMPGAVYGIMAALFAGFVSVLCVTLSNPTLVVPFGVCLAFIAAFFAVPAVFVGAAPEGEKQSLSWSKLMERGIATEHGRCSGREAVVLALLLPAFIFLWGVAVAVIVALV